ncbi:hypothetical protein SAMD00019534_031360 [Acytostelium subglobosum LB1]|uniref:hypothetical protein n=1 Tax=Acytostelium subglobosum LB1 TaxID=1410327 RepID=UPI000644A5DB|nr:hypothetical protein SAMD00019534_031360 [Acytostelium subglobosum LB1]GAM19961.1 hypothetical protein SAMD00019534_031360 [Acytostelium subglobosum LB1]|eukprot:XP_012756723.1 hypothetical protein SAMD00019534_031360 [Acytostelium subglobosum LB1]
MSDVNESSNAPPAINVDKPTAGVTDVVGQQTGGRSNSTGGGGGEQSSTSLSASGTSHQRQQSSTTTTTTTTPSSLSSSVNNNNSASTTVLSSIDTKRMIQTSLSSNDISFSPSLSPPPPNAGASPSIAPKKKTIDDFTIGKVLGEGSYGAVVLGTDKDTGVQYAIKILEKKHIIKENKGKYVQIEKEILCRSNHPNICKLFFTFRSDNCLYYVLELCSQGDLLHHIRKVGSFNYECTRFYTAQIISALEHLHGLRIVHRDLKPENILLSDDMHIKITDFGTGKILGNDSNNNLNNSSSSGGGGGNSNSISNSINNSSANGSGSGSGGNSNSVNLDVSGNGGELIRSNSFVGTAEYVSPELINNKETSTESDLWALGCIIYQLSTGRLPFRGKTEFLTFQKISNRELVYPTNMNAVIKDLIEKLLIVKPTDRLGSPAMGSFAKLKEHPFFEGVNWDTLSKQTPPPIVPPVEKIIFDDDLSSSANNSSAGGNGNAGASSNNLQQQHANPTPGPSLSQQQLAERTKWAQFLQSGETIIESGLVWKKKGFSIKKRQLILTSQPRLIYIDPKKMELKGEIPWSSSLKPEAKNNSNFIIQTPKRKYLLEDVDHNSQKWIDAISSTLSNVTIH